MNPIYPPSRCMCGAPDCRACFPDGDVVLVKVWDRIARKWAMVDLESEDEDWSRYNLEDLEDEV